VTKNKVEEKAKI